MPNKKRLILTLAIIIIVLLGAIIFLELRKDFLPQVSESPTVTPVVYIPDNPEASTSPRDWEETEFRKAVPIDIKVPEPSDVISEELKEEIAIPVAAIPAVPGIEEQLRVFNIRGEGGKSIPEKVIANFKDTVHIEFTAVDRDYDIIFTGYNMQQRAKKGETKVIEFQALQDGRFVYYCETCGGIDSEAKGEIIIVP